MLQFILGLVIGANVSLVLYSCIILASRSDCNKYM